MTPSFRTAPSYAELLSWERQGCLLHFSFPVHFPILYFYFLFSSPFSTSVRSPVFLSTNNPHFHSCIRVSVCHKNEFYNNNKEVNLNVHIMGFQIEGTNQ